MIFRTFAISISYLLALSAFAAAQQNEPTRRPVSPCQSFSIKMREAYRGNALAIPIHLQNGAHLFHEGESIPLAVFDQI